MRKVFLAGIFTLLGMVLAPSLQAQTIHLSHQGRLLDSGGNPVNNPGVGMAFRIYSVASGGSALWTEFQTVNVVNGFYDVILGSVTPIPVSFNAPPYWLGVEVGADPEMTPRQEITSAGHAVFADNAGSAGNSPLFQGLPPANYKTLSFFQNFPDTFPLPTANTLTDTTYSITFSVPVSGFANLSYTGTAIMTALDPTSNADAMGILFVVDGNTITNGGNFLTQQDTTVPTGEVVTQSMNWGLSLAPGTHTVSIGALSIVGGSDELFDGALSVIFTPQ